MTITPTAAAAAAIEHLRADERLWPLIRRRVYASPPDDPAFPYATVEPGGDGALRVTVVSDFGDEREVRWLLAAFRDSLEEGPFRVSFSDAFRSAFSPKQFIGVLRVRPRSPASASPGPSRAGERRTAAHARAARDPSSPDRSLGR